MGKPISTKNDNFIQGMFTPKNKDKYIGDIDKINYKSSWEKKFMLWADGNPDVIHWSSEPIGIPYFSEADNKWRRYFIDFIIRVKSSTGIKTHLVEIKPSGQVKPPKIPKNPNKLKEKNYKRMIKEHYDYQVNTDKWKFAQDFAKERNWEFTIITEYELGIKKA